SESLKILKQDLVQNLLYKGSLGLIKKYMKVLGIISSKENPYFKDRNEVKEFLESRSVFAIPDKDCLHLQNVISNIEARGSLQEINEQIFQENIESQKYRKILELTLKDLI